MPPFPERESSILAKLKRKKGPGHLPDIDDARRNVNGSTEISDSSESTSTVRPECRLQLKIVELSSALRLLLNLHGHLSSFSFWSSTCSFSSLLFFHQSSPPLTADLLSNRPRPAYSSPIMLSALTMVHWYKVHVLLLLTKPPNQLCLSSVPVHCLHSGLNYLLLLLAIVFEFCCLLLLTCLI